MAVLDVDEIETELCGSPRRSMEMFDDSADLAIGQEWIVRGQAQTFVENRMMVENLRLVAILNIRLAVTPRVGQLKPDDRIVIRPGRRSIRGSCQ